MKTIDIPMSLRGAQRRSNLHEAKEIASPVARNDNRPLLLAASFAAALGATAVAENHAQAQGTELPGETLGFAALESSQAMRDAFSPNGFNLIADGYFSWNDDRSLMADNDRREIDFTVLDDAATEGINIQASNPFTTVEELTLERRMAAGSYLRLPRGDGTPGARVWANSSIIQVNGETRFDNEANHCWLTVANIHPSPIANHLRIAIDAGQQPYLFDVPLDAPNYCSLVKNDPALFRVDELVMAGFDTKSAPCTPDGNVCVGIYENQNTREWSARLKGRNPQGTLVHLGCAANAQTGLLECAPEPRPGRTGRADPVFDYAQAFTTVRTPNGRNVDLFFSLPRVIPLDRVNGDASNLREVPATITLSPNPTPLDSDGDGNPDMTDRCPGRGDAEDITVAGMTGAEPRPEPYEPGAACAANCQMPNGQDHYPLTSEPADGQIQQENGMRLCESDPGIRDILGLPHALVNEDATLTLYANRPDIAVSPDTTEINTLPGDQFILVDTAAPTTPDAVRNLDRTIHIPPNFPARLRIFSATRPDGTPGRIVFRHTPVTDDDPFTEEVIWEGPPDPEALQDGWINLPAGSGGGGELGVEGCVLHLEVALEPVLPACPPVCGEPDAGQPPPADAGAQQDVGTPPQDAGQPVTDAGGAQDAEQPRPDAGPQDADEIASPDARNDSGDAADACDAGGTDDANPIVVPPVDVGCGQACAPEDAGEPPLPDAGQPPVADAGTADTGEIASPDARNDSGDATDAAQVRPDAGQPSDSSRADATDAVLVQPDGDAPDAQPQPDSTPVIPDTDPESPDAGDQGLPGQTPDAEEIASAPPNAGHRNDKDGCACEIASLNQTEAPKNPIFLLGAAIAAAYAGTRRRILNALRKQ